MLWLISRKSKWHLAQNNPPRVRRSVAHIKVKPVIPSLIWMSYLGHRVVFTGSSSLHLPFALILCFSRDSLTSLQPSPDVSAIQRTPVSSVFAEQLSGTECVSAPAAPLFLRRTTGQTSPTCWNKTQTRTGWFSAFDRSTFGFSLTWENIHVSDPL